MHVVERFANWAADWRSQPISKDVAHHARRAVIDWHAALLPGLVVGNTVRCPWHHACFSLETGAALRAPALNPVACYRVERQGDRIFVREKLPRDISGAMLNQKKLSREQTVRWHKLLYAHGWGAPSWPVEYGGTGWTATTGVACQPGSLAWRPSRMGARA